MTTMENEWPEEEKSDFLNFLIEKTKDANKHILLYELCGQYKTVTNSPRRLFDIVPFANKLLLELQNSDNVDLDTKVKMFGTLKLFPNFCVVHEASNEEGNNFAAVSTGSLSELELDEASADDRAIEEIDQEAETIVGEMLDLLAQKTETVEEQLTIAGFLDEYRVLYKREGKYKVLNERYERAKERILGTDYDDETKIRMLFLSKTIITSNILASLRDNGIVEVTKKGFMKSYSSNDGLLVLGNREKKKAAYRRESDDESDEDGDTDSTGGEISEDEDYITTRSGRNRKPRTLFDPSSFTASQRKRRNVKENIKNEPQDTPIKKMKRGRPPKVEKFAPSTILNPADISLLDESTPAPASGSAAFNSPQYTTASLSSSDASFPDYPSFTKPNDVPDAPFESLSEPVSPANEMKQPTAPVFFTKPTAQQVRLENLIADSTPFETKVFGFPNTVPSSNIITEVSTSDKASSAISNSNLAPLAISTSEKVLSPTPPITKKVPLKASTAVEPMVSSITIAGNDVPASQVAISIPVAKSSTVALSSIPVEDTDSTIESTPSAIDWDSMKKTSNDATKLQAPPQQISCLFDRNADGSLGDTKLFFIHNPSAPNHIDDVKIKSQNPKGIKDHAVDISGKPKNQLLNRIVKENVDHDNVSAKNNLTKNGPAEMINAKEFLQNLHNLSLTIHSGIFSDIQSKIEQAAATVGDHHEISTTKLRVAFDIICELVTP